MQGIAEGSFWSIDGPMRVNNASSTAFSISTESTWSTLLIQNTNTDDDTGLGIALKGHDSIGGIAHITTDTNKGRTSIISSTDGGTTNRESLTVSPEGYIGIGQINPTAAINTKGTLDTAFTGTVTVPKVGKVTSVTIVNGGSSITAGSLVFSGGGGTGAAGTYTVASGVIDTITITNAGSGYTSLPTVVGNGSSVNATLTAVVDSVVTIGSFTLSCTTTDTSVSLITTATSSLAIGMSVSGTGIPSGATIATILTATTFTISSAATASGTVTLTFSGSGIRAGDAVSLASGTGGTLETFTVSSVANTTQFLIDSLPTVTITSPSPAASNKMDSDFVKIESGDGNSLLIIDKTGHIGIGGAPRSSLDVVSTDAIILPAGITTQAPGGTASQIGTAVAGMVRFDSTSDSFRGYDGTAWLTLGVSGVRDADGDTKIDPEVTSDADDLVFYTAGSIRMTIDQAGDITHTGDFNTAGDVYTDIIRRQSDSSTTTKILLNDEDVQIMAGHATDEVLRVQSGIVTVDGEITVTTLDIGGTNITTTAAELNLIDGGTARGTDAIADGDGVLINDAGTMKMTTVQTLSAYLDDEITSMPNLTTAASLVTTAATTVGALSTGSIATGFGAINNGSDTITTTGLISGGSLTISGTTTVTGSLVIPVPGSVPSLGTNGKISLGYNSGTSQYHLYARFHDGTTRKVQLS